MSEYQRTVYNFNNRISLNDDVTDTTKYVLVDSKFFLDTIANNVEEEKPTEPGIIDYGIKFGKGTVEMPVVLFANTDANMSQLMQNLKAAFNPDLLEADPTYGDATDYAGYLPLYWTEVVGTATKNFMIYLKATETPAILQDSMAGLIRAATLKLKARDPRKYQVGGYTRTGNGVATNFGTYPTPVIITITASGATATNLTITNSTTGKSIYVTTAMSAGQVLVIDTFYHSVKLSGTEKRSMVGNNSNFWTISPGANNLAITNGTNASVAFSWHNAWPL